MDRIKTTPTCASVSFRSTIYFCNTNLLCIAVHEIHTGYAQFDRNQPISLSSDSHEMFELNAENAMKNANKLFPSLVFRVNRCCLVASLYIIKI